jgi:hypothetical protein
MVTKNSICREERKPHNNINAIQKEIKRKKELTLSLMLASIRKSKIKVVVFLVSGEGWHFHRHSSFVPSFSKVHDNYNKPQFLSSYENPLKFPLKQQLFYYL